MDTLWKVVAYASIALVALSAWSLVRSLHQDRPLRPRALALTVVVSIVALVVYERVLPAAPDGWAWGLGVVGLAGGGLVSRATRLSIAGPEIVGRPSPWIVVQWAVLFAVAQLAALGVLFDSAGAGLGALFLGTGVAVGGTLVLWRRRAQLAAHLRAGTRMCPHCHTALGAGVERCARCAWQVRTRAAAWGPPRAGG